MTLLSMDELKTLVEQPQGHCVSIYMPTQQAGSETLQNSIRFKNLIRQAAAQLEEHNISHTEALAFLQPATELDADEFWQHQDAGLAIFIADGFLHYYRVPLHFEELVVVSDRFHLKPLLPLLSGEGEFYVLALSQKQIRLFEGTHYGIREVELENVPQSVEAALQYDETAKEGQFRISTNKGGTNNSFQHAGSFHGQGSPDRDDPKADILQFFHVLDDALKPYLKDDRVPLVLAGVDYHLPLYQEANSYPHLIEAVIHTENIGVLKPEELHEKAWALVEPFYTQAQDSAVEQFHNLTGSGKTSTDLKEVVSGAFYGRVDQLFVAVGVQQWGNFDPQDNELALHSDAEPGDQDLLDAAAIQTILNGGTVYAVQPDAVPSEAPIAAVFRY